MFENLFKDTLIEKFDPDQPRHPAGTEDGGKWLATSEVAGNPAGSLMSEHTPYDSKTAGIKARGLLNEVLTPEQKDIFEANIAYVEKMLDDDPETGRNAESHRVYSKNPDGTGGFTDERRRVHRDLLNQIFKDEEKYKPMEGRQPHVIVLGGLGGSGKSRFGKSDESSSLGKYDASKYLKLDTDDFKTMLAIKDGVAFTDSEGRPSVGRNAYLYHEESSRLFDRAVWAARRRGLNVVLDVTMNSAHENRLKGFKDAGYKVSGYYMHLPNDEAARRAVLRHYDNGTMNGRLVPPDYVLTAKNNGKNFDLLLKHMDEAEVYRNDVPRGTKPKQVYSIKREKKSEELLVYKHESAPAFFRLYV